MGKNNNKPVRLPPPPEMGDADLEEKPFHSKEYEQEYLNSLLNAPERLTWDEFKEQQKKKGEMESDFARLEEEQQKRFRKELDAARAARLSGGAKLEKSEGSSKKDKKHKKEKKEKHKKKKRRKDSSDSEQGARKQKKSEKDKAEAPVALSSFFRAGSDSDS
mmetsp:Transcript_12002/g.20279  ORF Transcript_12002/g.20279 Transcript_12002/m.20279 type:complete len:162 (-) Transcript_12002:474-959(-)